MELNVNDECFRHLSVSGVLGVLQLKTVPHRDIYERVTLIQWSFGNKPKVLGFFLNTINKGVNSDVILQTSYKLRAKKGKI